MTSLNNLKNSLDGQLNLNPNKVMERSNFNIRNRHENENVSEYMAESRKISKTMQF